MYFRLRSGGLSLSRQLLVFNAENRPVSYRGGDSPQGYGGEAQVSKARPGNPANLKLWTVRTFSSCRALCETGVSGE
jgi:hypothetical protein